MHPGGGALRRAMAVVGRRPLAWCFAVLWAGLGLALIGLAAIGGLSLRPVLEQGGPAFQATVLIAAGTSSSEAESLRAALTRLDGVDSAAFVSRDSALAQIAARSAADREAIAQLAANPLPDVFTVMFRPGTAADSIDSAAGAMRKLPHVDGVQLDLSWYRKLRAALRFGRLGSQALLAFLAVNAFGWLLVALSLCVALDASQTRLLRLLGADDRLIRRPVVIAGSITALAAGVAALGIARLAWGWLEPQAAGLATTYSSPVRLAWPEPLWLAIALLGLWVAGALLVSIGARLRLAAIKDDGQP